jgi:hypothetical protein
MEERIRARIEELEQYIRQRETELLAARTVVAELQALLQPEMVVTEGEAPPA